MSRAKNAQQTKIAKNKYYSRLIDFLLESHTKQEIIEMLGVCDRAARDQIAECAMYYPVITNSQAGGYRRAKLIDGLTIEEMQQECDEVEHTINELRSREKQLKKRMKPLIAWKKVAEKRIEELLQGENTNNEI